MGLNVKRIKVSTGRKHTERPFTENERVRVRKLSEDQVDMVDEGLRTGRIHASEYVPLDSEGNEVSIGIPNAALRGNRRVSSTSGKTAAGRVRSRVGRVGGSVLKWLRT